MKTILVPTDFSDIAENAADYAAALAKFIDARIILLNVYSLPVSIVENPVTEFQFDEIDEKNKDLLKIFDRRLKAIHGEIETELISVVGFTMEEIILCIEQNNVDLMVMGIEGAGKSPTALSGNVISLIREVNCPVLTIPEGVEFRKPSRIALACDYSSIVPDEVVNKFKSFFKMFNAKVLVFDVLKKAEVVTQEKVMAEKNLEESLSDIEHTIHFPTGEDLIGEMNSFVDRHVVDILAMIPHHHNLFKKIFHRSSTKQMALNTHIPLLTVHE